MSTKAAENNNLVPAQPKTKDEGTPENNAKIHVHDATEKTEDIKPKQVGPENAKEILTGALAQKVSEFNVRFKKKAYSPALPLVNGQRGFAEAPVDSAMAKRPWNWNAVRDEENAMGANYSAPRMRDLHNKHMTGDHGFQWLGDKSERAPFSPPATTSQSQKRFPTPALLPSGQPRPPVVQPPRGTGSSLLNKKAADLLPLPNQKPVSPNDDIHMGQFAAAGGTLGAALGGAAGGTVGGLAGLISPGTYEENGVKKKRNRLMGGLTGAGNGAMAGVVGGGVVGGLGGAGLLQMMRNMENARTAPKTAALNDYGSIGGGAMVGGLGGAALGGLAGLISPGQETEYDNYGRPVGSKQRSRLGAALRGALGGGAIGGLGGAAAGHFMPGQTNQALAALQPYLNSAQEYGKGMYNKMFPQKDNIAVPAGSVAKRDEAGAPITVAPKAIPAASSPTANPKAGIDLPPTKPPSQGFFPSLINGITAGPW